MRDSRALALTRYHDLPLQGQPAARKASCPRPWPQEEVHPSARRWGSRRKTRVRSRCHSPRTRRPPALHCSSLGPWQAACVFHLTLRWPTHTKGQSGLRLHERFENKEVTSSPTVPETRDQGEKMFPKPRRKSRLCKLTHDVSPASRKALVPSFPLIPALTNY